MVGATLWRMDHTPLRLSRTQCGISLSATPRLAPKEQRTHDAQPNPRMDNSGLREVIEEAGPQPGRLSFGVVAAWAFIGLVGLFMCSMSIPFFTGSFGPPQKQLLRSRNIFAYPSHYLPRQSYCFRRRFAEYSQGNPKCTASAHRVAQRLDRIPSCSYWRACVPAKGPTTVSGLISIIRRLF